MVLHDKVEHYTPHAETSHTEHGLTYLVDGWFEIEHGRPIRVEPGTVTIIPAGVPHRPLAGEDMDYWLVGFCASCLRLDEGQLLMSPFSRVRRGALPVVSIPESRRAHLLDLIGELRDAGERGGPESPQVVGSLLTLVLAEVRRAMPGGDATGPSGSLVSDALELIQRRCLEPISLQDVAAAVHRTPAHVTATIKKSTGYSVGEWITAGRVAEAAARLAHTDDSLEEIANQVGWQDKTHFIRQFKKAYGVTPAAWRRQQHARHG